MPQRGWPCRVKRGAGHAPAIALTRPTVKRWVNQLNAWIFETLGQWILVTASHRHIGWIKSKSTGAWAEYGRLALGNLTPKSFAIAIMTWFDNAAPQPPPDSETFINKLYGEAIFWWMDGLLLPADRRLEAMKQVLFILSAVAMVGASVASFSARARAEMAISRPAYLVRWRVRSLTRLRHRVPTHQRRSLSSPHLFMWTSWLLGRRASWFGTVGAEPRYAPVEVLRLTYNERGILAIAQLFWVNKRWTC